jgi:hypothetical protein
MRGYWPLQTDDTTGITDYLNGVSKYAVSSTLQDPGWERRRVSRKTRPILGIALGDLTVERSPSEAPRVPERDPYSAAVSRIAHLQASSPHSHRKELITPSVAGLPRASAVDSLSSHERACVSGSRSRQLAMAVTVAAAVAVDGRA